MTEEPKPANERLEDVIEAMKRQRSDQIKAALDACQTQQKQGMISGLLLVSFSPGGIHDYRTVNLSWPDLAMAKAMLDRSIAVDLEAFIAGIKDAKDGVSDDG